MPLIDEILLRSGIWVRQYQSDIGLMVTVTLLVIYGDNINRLVKQQLRSYHKLIRLTGFILLCVFGYGLLTTLLAPILAQQLARVSTYWLMPVVVSVFLLIGWLAERKHQM